MLRVQFGIVRYFLNFYIFFKLNQNSVPSKKTYQLHLIQHGWATYPPQSINIIFYISITEMIGCGRGNLSWFASAHSVCVCKSLWLLINLITFFPSFSFICSIFQLYMAAWKHIFFIFFLFHMWKWYGMCCVV